MASTDSPEDNRGFAEKNDASFPILSDVDGEMSAAYGVLSPSGMARRATFYIDPEGRIIRIDDQINVRTAGQELVENLQDLGVPGA